MATIEGILDDTRRLSLADQRRLLRELARWVFQSTMTDLGARQMATLPLTDDEIDQVVHEARSETLRARGH